LNSKASSKTRVATDWIGGFDVPLKWRGNDAAAPETAYAGSNHFFLHCSRMFVLKKDQCIIVRRKPNGDVQLRIENDKFCHDAGPWRYFNLQNKAGSGNYRVGADGCLYRYHDELGLWVPSFRHTYGAATDDVPQLPGASGSEYLEFLKVRMHAWCGVSYSSLAPRACACLPGHSGARARVYICIHTPAHDLSMHARSRHVVMTS
jgi:hypothetical protein